MPSSFCEEYNSRIKADLIYRSRGCAKCNNIGYKGRECIAEVMAASEEIRELINQKASFQKIRDTARASGMQTLYESSLKKVEQGIISLEEALSVTLGED